MSGATLIVSRATDRSLHFVLQHGGAAAARAQTGLDEDQRRKISDSLEDFAECLKGFAADEPKFRGLGQILFRILVPQSLWPQLGHVKDSLTILTDDPTLPWEILHDEEEFLSLKLAVSRELIVQEQMAAFLRVSALPKDPDTFSALIIADPTEDLPGARQEGTALHRFLKEYGPCQLIAGREATWDKILVELIRRPYAVIHYCGHVDYDSAKRTSSIRLRNAQVTSGEMLKIFRGRPVVFLNACYSDWHDRQSQSSAQCTESFAQAFMLGNEHGLAQAVVGSMWKIPDEPECAGQEFCQNFYDRLLRGEALGEALRASRTMAREKQWGPMVWGPYVLYGDPTSSPLSLQACSSGQPQPSATQPRQTKVKEVSAPSGSTKVPPSEPENDQPPTKHKAPELAPLDTTARQVFHTAIREMQQMGQGGLGTMHLLIGLCEAGVRVLKEGLQQAGADPKDVCENARLKAREVIPDSSVDFGVSPNVGATLLSAVQHSRLLGHDSVTGDDLLAGLLQCETGTAVEILEQHKIKPQQLLDRLGHFRIGPLGPTDCTTDAWQILMFAWQAACGSTVGTPHLFMGMLRAEPGPLAAALRRLGINPDCVRHALGLMPAEGGKSAGQQ